IVPTSFPGRIQTADSPGAPRNGLTPRLLSNLVREFMARRLGTICGDQASTTGTCPWPKAWHSRSGCTSSCVWTHSIRSITHTSMLPIARSVRRDLVRSPPPDPDVSFSWEPSSSFNHPGIRQAGSGLADLFAQGYHHKNV